MGLFLGTLPDGFPEEMKQTHYFLQALSGQAAIWTVRILAVLLFLGMIGWWIYLEYKNRPGDK